MKTALFVDFDNVYIGLRNSDPEAAEAFAREPSVWLGWIERGMPIYDDTSPCDRRSVLVRKCYLNPRDFQKYRRNFVRAAFEVIDCPPLTGQGKNSTDIRMVMDILDALEHTTRFDEFFLLSADADFTPVLMRLRSHDRRTAVLAIGYAAEAYTAACDLVVPEETFVAHGLGVDADEPVSVPLNGNGAPAADANELPVPPALLERMAVQVLRAAIAQGPLGEADLPRVYEQFPELSAAENGGFRSLRALTEQVVARHAKLQIIDGDPWRVVARGSAALGVSPASAPISNGNGGSYRAQEVASLRDQIIEVVKKLVAESPRPVNMAWAAKKVQDELGDRVIESRWAGTGSFTAALRSVPSSGFEIHTGTSPGWLRDPARHGFSPHHVDVVLRPALQALSPELVQLMQRINELTRVPILAPQEYEALFTAIAEKLRLSPYQLWHTASAAEDMVRQRGFSIPKANIIFVLRGILYGGLPLDRAPYVWSAEELAAAFHKNVARMCEHEELRLSSDDGEVVRRWIVGTERRAEA